MSDTPKRLQRKRTRGWRMPDGAVYVGRPSQWGNPHRITHRTVDLDPYCSTATARVPYSRRRAAEESVAAYRDWLPETIKQVARSDLRGRDLVCWCRLCDAHRDGKPAGVECPYCEPCHADVLLEIAND